MQVSHRFLLKESVVSAIRNYASDAFALAERMISQFFLLPVESLHSFDLMKHQISNIVFYKSFFNKPSMADGRNVFVMFEYDAFYKEHFEGYGNEFDELRLTTEQTGVLFDMNALDLSPKRSWNTLLHWSNLTDLRDSCKSFWDSALGSNQQKLSDWEKVRFVRDSPTEQKDYEMLRPIIIRFGLKNEHQAEVLCGFVEFVVSKKLLLDSGGDFEMYNLTQFFSENSKQVIREVEVLADRVLKTSFVNWMSRVHPDLDCTKILAVNSIISPQKVAAICDLYQQADTPRFLTDLYENCETDSPSSPFVLNQVELLDLCTFTATNSASYLSLVLSLYEELGQIYQTQKVSKTNLALLQMVKSSLSLGENPYISDQEFPPGLSVQSWAPSVFAKPFEWAYFADKFDLSPDFLNWLDLDRISNFFSHNAFFNASALYNCVVSAFNDDFELAKSILGVDQDYFASLWRYVVLFVREYYLQGFYIEVSKREILEGIDSPFLRDLKTRPVLMGGDPTIASPYKIRPQNFNLMVRKNTGGSDYRLVDHLVGLNNWNFLILHRQYFNGNDTDEYPIKPWKYKLRVDGCDKFCSEDLPSKSSDIVHDTQVPDSDPLPDIGKKDDRKISPFWFRFGRTFGFDFHETVNFKDTNIRLNRYRLNQEQYQADSEMYYQTELNGFFNLTSVLNQPILSSQNHQSMVEPTISSNFSYLDKDLNPVFSDPTVDGGSYEVEDVTDVVARMRMNHHFHLQIRPDRLFVGCEKELEPVRVTGKDYFVAPVYNLETAVDLGDEQIESMFHGVDSIRRSLRHYHTIVLIVLSLFVVIFGVFVFLFVRNRKEDRLELDSISLDSDERLVGHENMHMAF